jgi:ribosomal protein S18 acetylase RimI-like enzyme
MGIEIKLLEGGDDRLFARVLPDVFDHAVKPEFVAEFLGDPRHHIAVAIDDGRIVGFVSAVHYIHPDKEAELWINEVSVAPAYREQGLAKKLLEVMFELGAGLGCVAAWVGTERTNTAAMNLYTSVGQGTAALEDFVMFTFPLAGRVRKL